MNWNIYSVTGVAIILWGTFYVFQKYRESRAPYFRVKKKIADDLLHAKVMGEWKNWQKINLLRLWIDNVREFNLKDVFGNKKEMSDSEILLKLTERELIYPSQWSLDDYRIVTFSQSIIQEYGLVISTNKYKGMYKPESILPYPKNVIFMAIQFTLDYAEYEKALRVPIDRKELTLNLSFTRVLLSKYFVDTGLEDLPIEVMENMERGKYFASRQQKTDEEVPRFQWATG